MSLESPYLIMFAPDICGPGTKKVHVIFNYKGKNLLMNKDIRCKDDVYSHLYTLLVKPDNTYIVKIDNEKVESGELEKDWNFLPPTKINDPEAKKPEDWDDEMDGEWKPPQINNPAYKGEWKPKQIDNPNYKGLWIHPEIDNPGSDPFLYRYTDICVFGFDLWQEKSGTIFDNVLIMDDEDFAQKVGEETWGTEHKMKEEQDEEERKKAEAEVRKDDEEEEEEEEDEDTESATDAPEDAEEDKHDEHSHQEL